MAAQIKIVMALDESSPRARTRRINVAAPAARALSSGMITVAHGGSVANSYGYPAWTQGVVVVPVSDTCVVAWTVELPANKVTHSGVLARCIGDHVRAVLDVRYGDDATEQARWYVLSEAAREADMEIEDVWQTRERLAAQAALRKAQAKAREAALTLSRAQCDAADAAQSLALARSVA